MNVSQAKNQKLKKPFSYASPFALLSLTACGGDETSSSKTGHSPVTVTVDTNQANNFTPMSAPISIDINSDGTNETLLSFHGYPDFPELDWIILGEDNNTIANIAPTLLTTSVSTQQTRQIFQIDIDSDGDLDIVAGDVGMDLPPWTGGGVTILLNENNVFTDISLNLPEGASTARAYAIAAGNLDNDSNIEIIVPDTNGTMGFGNGGVTIEILNNDGVIEFAAQQSPLSTINWEYQNASLLEIEDIDGDGVNDLYVGGNWVSPNNTIYYSGFLATERNILPETNFGHYSGSYDDIGSETVSGADVNSVLFHDYDNDGDIDIITLAERVNVTNSEGSVNVTYENTELQILEQNSVRVFTNDDTFIDLGFRYYGSAENVDINNDGLMDFIAHYFVKGTTGSIAPWGSSIFINQGNLTFTKIDSIDFINAKSTSEYGTISIFSKNADNTYRAIISEPKLDGSHTANDTYLITQFVDIYADLNSVQLIA